MGRKMGLISELELNNTVSGSDKLYVITALCEGSTNPGGSTTMWFNIKIISKIPPDSSITSNTQKIIAILNNYPSKSCTICGCGVNSSVASSPIDIRYDETNSQLRLSVYKYQSSTAAYQYCYVNAVTDVFYSEVL